MILADKITELRKKNAWSQEELAEKLDVSRQSISKWESAQSVPDMNRILRLSELFGVSTDYLLKDELESDSVGLADAPAPEQNEMGCRGVSMEEASAFLEHCDKASRRVSLGVMLCIFSPVLLILLGALQDAGRVALTEQQATGLGLLPLILLIGCAVALFVVTGLRGQKYEYMEKEWIETSYGVDGMVRERRERFRSAYTTQLVCGILLCVLSVTPLFAAMFLFDDGRQTPYAVAVALLLLLVGVGVLLIVHASILWGGYAKLLQEGESARENKAENKRNALLGTVFWCAVTALYLGYSFITGYWGRSWIVWPIAGVLYGAVAGIMQILNERE
jgi:transcriptional regulator with XRE-family HTH domain